MSANIIKNIMDEAQYLTSMINDYGHEWRKIYKDDKQYNIKSSGFYCFFVKPGHTSPPYNVHLEKYNFLENMIRKLWGFVGFNQDIVEMFNTLFTKNLIQTKVKCIVDINKDYIPSNPSNYSIVFRIYI